MFGSPLYPVPPPACWNRCSFDRSAVLSQSQRNALYSGRGRRNFYKCHDVDMDCDDLNQTSARPYCALSQLEAAKDWVPWVREEYQHHVGMRGISHHTFAWGWHVRLLWSGCFEQVLFHGFPRAAQLQQELAGTQKHACFGACMENFIASNRLTDLLCTILSHARLNLNLLPPGRWPTLPKLITGCGLAAGLRSPPRHCMNPVVIAFDGAQVAFTTCTTCSGSLARM